MNVSPAVRRGSALVGVAGALLLSGCAAGATPAAVGSTPQATSETGVGAAPAPSTGSSPGAYRDGSYTANGSYRTPETVERITVSVTLAGGTVTRLKVTGDPQASETRHYQAQFIGGIQALVVGKRIDDISVSRVAGSSLTSRGFNQALATIRTEAAG
ncbi:FMN-binding protein [Microbacterium capsulatum]|uniref:FMN-binding protein n=1 Tax=Microbacterium capsulatum TaxID=3041921 RepID=A0ABU0XH84_9MICO|nr:FMN-binding protein [Microbacterium sp. ASV81]MDQ4214471.1 FMN-binding protein [Microbacterium sp. ASV81]